MMGGMMGGPGGPGMGPGGPPGSGPGDADANSAKKGLVNDPMAGLPPGGPPPGYPFPGQWGPGPMGPMGMGPGGPGGPGWGPHFGGPGGPPGPWGPHPPPIPPGMMCVSQGNSGKPCRHFQRGSCTYGNRCIHLHLVPAGGPGGEDEEEEDSDDDENHGPTGDKRAQAKKAAFEEAMRAAKAAAAKAGDLPISATEDGTPGATSDGRHAILHGFSVGQKGKKKDPKPEEQRPGDWQCTCGNYNFSWRKTCNACDQKKPFSKAEQDSRSKELDRIKEDRSRRRGAEGGVQEDLRERMKRKRQRWWSGGKCQYGTTGWFWEGREGQ